MTFQNSINNRETEPDPLSVLLRCVEWFKNVRKVLWRDPDTRILDEDIQVTFMWFLLDFDNQFASSGHCFDGVDEQSHQSLLNLVLIALLCDENQIQQSHQSLLNLILIA